MIAENLAQDDTACPQQHRLEQGWPETFSLPGNAGDPLIHHVPQRPGNLRCGTHHRSKEQNAEYGEVFYLATPVFKMCPTRVNADRQVSLTYNKHRAILKYRVSISPAAFISGNFSGDAPVGSTRLDLPSMRPQIVGQAASCSQPGKNLSAYNDTNLCRAVSKIVTAGSIPGERLGGVRLRQFLNSLIASRPRGVAGSEFYSIFKRGAQSNYNKCR